MDQPAIPALSPPDAPSAGMARGNLVIPKVASEWTLLAALASVTALSVLVVAVLTSVRWGPASAATRIWFLGWMGLLAVGGSLLLIVAISSPWIGKVTASAAGAELDVEGRS